MSEAATVQLVVLVEQELRQAAKLIRDLNAVLPSDDATEEQKTVALRDALRAAWVALAHLAEDENDRACVMLTSATELFMRGRPHLKPGK